MIAISLGWGVQSFTLAAMSALGELPPVDVAIHADTTHEASSTYEFAAKWTPWIEERGIKVITARNVTGGFWKLFYKGQIHVPFYTMFDGTKEFVEYDENDNAIGSYTAHVTEPGQLHRSCTSRWKIVTIRRWLQANRNGQPVEQWIGISLDEFQRMRDSDVKYITHRWPLIEKRMTRNDCKKWLTEHGLEIPPKSSCVFCPYHDTRAWQELKHRGGKDWQLAVMVDNAIRKARPPYDLFIHPSRKPLELVDLRTEEDRGQLSLWDNECSGLCGV